MKRVVIFFLWVNVACSPSPEEQAVYNAEPGITDIKSLEKVEVLTAGDSVPILNKILDSLALVKRQRLVDMTRRHIDSSSPSLTILDEYQKRLTFYETKTYDSTDLRDTYARLKRYQANPDSVLADRYRCVYTVGKQEIEKTYYFRNGKVIK